MVFLTVGLGVLVQGASGAPEGIRTAAYRRWTSRLRAGMLPHTGPAPPGGDRPECVAAEQFRIPGRGIGGLTPGPSPFRVRRARTPDTSPVTSTVSRTAGARK